MTEANRFANKSNEPLENDNFIEQKLLNQQEDQKKIPQSCYLSLDGISSLDLKGLIEPNTGYSQWLRVIILRAMINTNALNGLKNSYTFSTTQLYGFLGFKNFEEFSKKRDLITLRDDLFVILNLWEQELGEESYFPSELAENLEELSKLAGLNKVETKILGFGILLHSEGILQEAVAMMGERISGFSVAKIFAATLNLRMVEVEKALDDRSNLIRSGLLSLDHHGEGDLRSRVDLLNWSFAKCAVIKQRDVRDLLKAYIHNALPTVLTVKDYEHISERFNIFKDYLAFAVSTKRRGVNILIYGGAGLGKSELAKLLAREIGSDLMEVAVTNLSGNPVTPMRRIRSYRLAQSLLQQGNMMLLFDECEEVLSGQGMQTSDVDPSLAQKSWINMILEENACPAIWVCNSIAEFEDSYIRRFDMVFEMPMPNEQKRRDMLLNICGRYIDQGVIAQIAKNKNTSPALVNKTAQVVEAVASTKCLEKRNEIALMLVNDKLSAQGAIKVQTPEYGAMDLDFRPAMINSPICLTSLCAGIERTREARILLYGPPGTGKTRFGKWLADSLSMAHMIVKPSDLLGSYVGESERHIVKAFATASFENALLQFDECDTFLMDRRNAKHNWESSLTATMLLEMECYRGVFIASTNLMDGIDDAAKRRFDMTIKFDYMVADKAWEMFLHTCTKLGLILENFGLRKQLDQLTNLTPGDFEQVCRQSRFLPLRSAQEVINHLSNAVAAKKCTRSRHIGFLDAN